MEWYYYVLVISGLMLGVGFIALIHYEAIKPLVKKQVNKWHILVALIEGIFFYFAITWLIKDFTGGNIAMQELIKIMPIPLAYFGGLGYLALRGFIYEINQPSEALGGKG